MSTCVHNCKLTEEPYFPVLERQFTDIFFKVFIYFGCTEFPLLHADFLQLQRAGLSLPWFLLLQSTGPRCVGFSSCGARGLVLMAHGLSCSAACGIFPEQGSNPCSLHWQANS